MGTKTFSAHFDGKEIKFDEPCQLEQGTKLLVTVLPKEQQGDEREDWIGISTDGLRYAYGANEIDYSRSLIKEPNPEYEGR
ncbi:MAG: hypothetical protein ACRDGA_07390 [Bacteroidota bacterium]